MEYISLKDVFAVNFMQIWFVRQNSFEQYLLFKIVFALSQKTSQFTAQERPQARLRNLNRTYKPQTLRSNREPSVLITKKFHAVKQMTANTFLYLYIIATVLMNNQGNLQPGLWFFFFFLVTLQIFYNPFLVKTISFD